MKKSHYRAFAENLAQDIGFFLFFLILLSLYRAGFLFEFRNLLAPDTACSDLGLTMWYGLRLSLKTCGAIVLPCFVLGTLAQTVFTNYPAKKVRLILGLVCCFGFALLYQTRIPYYQEFQSAFSPFVFNTFHDDVYAIVRTAIDQYHALWRTLAGLLLGAVSGALLYKWLPLAEKLGAPLARIKRPAWAVAVIAVGLVPLAMFLRWGGALSYKGSIYWKNSARMDQHLLNEAILDDVQALYKASRIFKQFTNFSRDLSPQDVRAAAERLKGKPLTGNSLLPALEHTAKGAKIEKPRHIFVIVAETYMLWPLLDEYKDLPVAQGMRGLIARPDAVFVPHFLSASNGTMFGLTSVVLGLPELNLLTANRPSAQKPYETSLAVQLKKQGYKTRFFYGGFPSWENVGEFMRNQGFEESFYYGDFDSKGNVWGIADKVLFQGTAPRISDEPSLNVILTSTNHPPYTLDMAQEPGITPAAEMDKLIPASVADRSAMIQRLQHFEYSDKYLAEFVQTLMQKYPDSLFVITGDHADRWTLNPNPSRYERFAVPLVLVGKGISKDMLPARAAGAHEDIVPTVLELILPEGTPYYAAGADVLGEQTVGLHAYYFITADVLGEINSQQTEVLPQGQMPAEETLQAVRSRLEDIQTISAWRVLNGTEL